MFHFYKEELKLWSQVAAREIQIVRGAQPHLLIPAMGSSEDEQDPGAETSVLEDIDGDK